MGLTPCSDCQTIANALQLGMKLTIFALNLGYFLANGGHPLGKLLPINFGQFLYDLLQHPRAIRQFLHRLTELVNFSIAIANLLLIESNLLFDTLQLLP